MRILFISEYISQKEISGARTASQLHYDVLVRIVGKKNVDVVALHHYENSYRSNSFVMMESYKNKIEAFINVLNRNSTLVNSSIKRKIYDLCSRNKYDVVFLDNRLMGSILPKIKKNFPQILCLTNFHGISRYQKHEVIDIQKRYSQYVTQIGNVIAEEKAVNYSDIVFLMHPREYDRFVGYYGEKKHYFLPCVLNDIHDPNNIVCEMNPTEFNLLFVGGYFKPNNEGVAWFVNEVMPKLNKKIHFYIVGNHIEKIKEEFCLPDFINVHYIGRVEDLNPWYQCANIVVGPIFSGDGMKTKTAEALMFGKRIIGTQEALSGYGDITGKECNSAEEFIQEINQQFSENNPKYDQHNRKRYLNEFSIEAIEKTIRKCLDENLSRG